jgi:hypothetical protein
MPKRCIAASGKKDAWLQRVWPTLKAGWTNFDRCFQLLECADQRLLDKWAGHWRDLVEFEFFPVRRSKDAVDIIMSDR